MPKELSALEELQQVYKDHVRLEKSRVRKAKERGENDPPADDDEMKQYDTRKDEDRDNREEDEAQYGNSEPKDEADEEATRRAGKRQRRAYDEDDDDTRKSRKARKSRREDDDDDDDEDDEDRRTRKSRRDDDEDEDEDRDVRKSRRGDSATRAIRDSQDSYLKEDDDDDLHGYAEDMDEEEGTGDDQTIISNMGRKVRPGVKKSRSFYKSLIRETGFDSDFFDANPAVERMADTVGQYLDASDRRYASLAKSNNELHKSNEQLMKSVAALLRTVDRQQAQLDNFATQPVDNPQPGYASGWDTQVDSLSKSQAARNKQQQSQPKLTKSMVRERLNKGMVNEIVEPSMLGDFDNSMARGLTADQWADMALTSEQRQALGL